MNWPDLNVDAFQSVNATEWMQLIKNELKGKDAAWLAENGLSLSPFIHREDKVEGNKLPPKSLPTQGNDWLIAQEFHNNDDLLEGLKSGVSKIIVNYISPDQLQSLLRDVYLNMVELDVRCNWNDRMIVTQTIADLAGPLHINEIRLSFLHDPISNALDNNNPSSALSALAVLPANSGDVKAVLAKTKTINVEAYRLYEAGASHSLEVAYALAAGRSYLDAFIAANWSVDDAAPLIQFSLSADADYFVTIAKFRSFRLAWAALIQGYNAQHDCSVITWVNAVTSKRIYSNNELYNNLLRSTISTMGAVIGCADAVVTTTYNQAHDADALRWARNIQHLLCDESGIDKVYDPGYGIGYVEHVTNEMLKQVYALLDDWSNAGELVSTDGFNWLINQLNISQSSFIEKINNGETTLVGINKFLMSNKAMKCMVDKTSALAALKLIEVEMVS